MIALIGEKEIWKGFIPLGVTVFEVDNGEQVIKVWEEIKKCNYKFLFLSEYAGKLIEDNLDDLYKQTQINVVLLPSLDDKKNEDKLYYKRLKSIVEKAMGVDIL
ncbi:MAG: hypothetical protein LBF97_04740 [Elusimicrobiota bacterium]|jgi:vacuolar-type H+-ATPase subunit F/Vma7|nr:hypothetical protein [Elusimicrobiota bacterium]